MAVQDEPPSPVVARRSVKPGVGIFVGHWLPFSETFIYAQVAQHSGYAPRVLARGFTPYADRFPHQPVVVPRGLERWTYPWGGSRRYRRALRDVSVIHAHYGLNGVVALPYAEAAGLPLVVTFHGHDVAGLFPENRNTLRYGRYQRWAPRLFDRASRLLAVSEELADRLREAGAPAHKIHVHRLGVDLRGFSVPDRSGVGPTVLMVGRMVEKKGMADGIRAFARIAPAFPAARLRVIGDGPLRPRLEQTAREAAVPVEFSGVLDGAGVRRAMAEAQLLLAPSKVAPGGDREGLPIVLKEAGASGLAVLATRHGGIPELIRDGENGLLAPEGDVEGLAERLRALLSDPDLRLRLGRAARRSIETDWDGARQIARLEGHFDAVLSSPAVRPHR
jgi:glycosyltransferase involved in cell wall biosynthesis